MENIPTTAGRHRIAQGRADRALKEVLGSIACEDEEEVDGSRK